MGSFPEVLQYSIASHIDTTMDWIVANFKPFFDAFSAGVLSLLLQFETLLLWLPWWLVLLLILCLGWRATGKVVGGLILAALMFLIGVIGLWSLTMQTMAIVLTAVVVSLLFGIPIGIAMARFDRLDVLLKPFLDSMQTMPSFVYLIPALMLFGVGKVPAVFATIIYAIPPVIRLTNLGIRQVPEDIVEAAEAFGSTPLQTLFKVQLPLAAPTIMSGVNQTTMMALAMVVIASMIGARGVGEQVLIAIGRIEIGRGFEAGLTIVFLAIITDRILQGMAKKRQH